MNLTTDHKQAMQAAFYVACIVGAKYHVWALYTGMVYMGALALLLIFGLGTIAAMVANGEKDEIAQPETEDYGSTAVRFLSFLVMAAFVYTVYQHGWTLAAGFFTFLASLSLVSGIMFTIFRHTKET